MRENNVTYRSEHLIRESDEIAQNLRIDALETTRRKELKAFIYILSVLLSYIVMLGGFAVFILLLLGVSPYLITGGLSAYLALAIAALATFLHVPIRRFGLRRYFLGGSLFFLLMSIALLSQWLYG
ncbi:MAG: hypothetical protein J7J17_00360 [Hadesarchaea archaeon]|nr:hypothetical protein [Hadesarchaea archaeon]